MTERPTRLMATIEVYSRDGLLQMEPGLIQQSMLAMVNLVIRRTPELDSVSAGISSFSGTIKYAGSHGILLKTSCRTAQ